MNYRSITDKPFIHVSPGKTIWSCTGCLKKRFANPDVHPMETIQNMVCPCCKERETCYKVERKRLTLRVPNPRKSTISKRVMERCGIIRR